MKICKKGLHQYEPIPYSDKGCIECKKEYGARKRKEHPEISKAYRIANKERIYRMQKEWRLKNKDRTQAYLKANRAHYTRLAKKSRLKSSYGITLDAYDQMFIAQKGCCAICRTPQSALTRIFGVDHNHSTGEIRGLLCSPCNTGIGLLKESPDILRAAINYLIPAPSNLVPFKKEN